MLFALVLPLLPLVMALKDGSLHNYCHCVSSNSCCLSIQYFLVYRPNHRGEDMWRRDDLPPFVAPPEGTREADEEKERWLHTFFSSSGHKQFSHRANRARVNQQQRQGHLSQNPHQGTRSTCSCRAFTNQTVNHDFPTGNPNVNHSGPPSTGKPVEGFVIMLKPHENAVCRPLFLLFSS